MIFSKTADLNMEDHRVTRLVGFICNYKDLEFKDGIKFKDEFGAWISPFDRLQDHKGTLTICWAKDPTIIDMCRAYGAWNMCGEYQIIHQFGVRTIRHDEVERLLESAWKTGKHELI